MQCPNQYLSSGTRWLNQYQDAGPDSFQDSVRLVSYENGDFPDSPHYDIRPDLLCLSYAYDNAASSAKIWPVVAYPDTPLKRVYGKRYRAGAMLSRHDASSSDFKINTVVHSHPTADWVDDYPLLYDENNDRYLAFSGVYRSQTWYDGSRLYVYRSTPEITIILRSDWTWSTDFETVRNTSPVYRVSAFVPDQDRQFRWIDIAWFTGDDYVRRQWGSTDYFMWSSDDEIVVGYLEDNPIHRTVFNDTWDGWSMPPEGVSHDQGLTASEYVELLNADQVDIAIKIFQLCWNLRSRIRYIADPAITPGFWTYFQYNLGATGSPDQLATLDGRGIFLFMEDEIIFNQVDAIFFGKEGNLRQYWLNSLSDRSFRAACQDIPKLNDNTIANIKEVVEFIYNLVVKRKIEIPKSLSSLWLAYRYQYNTTKLDAQEAARFVRRHSDWKREEGFSCYGSASSNITFDGHAITATMRCTFHAKSKELDQLGKILDGLCTYGLMPDFYVIWDMIPYSFIVDWFLPVAGIAEEMDIQSNVYDNYDIYDVCYSLSYDTELDGIPYKTYSRWRGDVPSNLNAFYWYDNEVSDRTLWMRVLDTLSILN
jgi:hypothetical protein